MAANKNPGALAGGNRDGSFLKNNPGKYTRETINFQRINAVALPRLPALVARWAPGGKRIGHEYVARNPRRADTKPGSFSIN